MTRRLLRIFKISDVNKRVIDSIPEIISRLKKNEAAKASAFLGFDACIDSIIRVVRDKDKNSEKIYFNTSSQFGEFLISQKNKSCGIELDTKLSKIGGNMVITANALGNLGIEVECIGTFGYPEILPVFRSISDNCKLHTVADTITASALEFNDSKVIVFDPGPYNKLTWEDIKNIVGIENLRTMLTGKQLISFLNWSEIENSSAIWTGFLEEVIPTLPGMEKKYTFFTDFSDCSRKSGKEISYVIDLLGRFRDYFRVTLSLNLNEAELVAHALNVSTDSSEEEFIRSMYKVCNCDLLVIHRVNDAFAYNGINFEKCGTFYCSEPTVLTGGGDNFNAGFCFALLKDLDLFQTILMANAVSGSYVKTGISPSVDKLIEFLKQNSFLEL